MEGAADLSKNTIKQAQSKNGTVFRQVASKLTVVRNAMDNRQFDGDDDAWGGHRRAVPERPVFMGGYLFRFSRGYEQAVSTSIGLKKVVFRPPPNWGF